MCEYFSSRRVSELGKRPGSDLAALLWACGAEAENGSAEWAGIELRYSGYIEREREMVSRMAELEGFVLPADVPYREIQTLSFEAREKLHAIRPTTLGQAGRIPGVSPSDLQNLVLEILKREGQAASTSS